MLLHGRAEQDVNSDPQWHCASPARLKTKPTSFLPAPAATARFVSMGWDTVHGCTLQALLMGAAQPCSTPCSAAVGAVRALSCAVPLGFGHRCSEALLLGSAHTPPRLHFLPHSPRVLGLLPPHALLSGAGGSAWRPISPSRETKGGNRSQKGEGAVLQPHSIPYPPPHLPTPPAFQSCVPRVRCPPCCCAPFAPMLSDEGQTKAAPKRLLVVICSTDLLRPPSPLSEQAGALASACEERRAEW